MVGVFFYLQSKGAFFKFNVKLDLVLVFKNVSTVDLCPLVAVFQLAILLLVE